MGGGDGMSLVEEKRQLVWGFCEACTNIIGVRWIGSKICSADLKSKLTSSRSHVAQRRRLAMHRYESRRVIFGPLKPNFAAE